MANLTSLEDGSSPSAGGAFGPLVISGGTPMHPFLGPRLHTFSCRSLPGWGKNLISCRSGNICSVPHLLQSSKVRNIKIVRNRKMLKCHSCKLTNRPFIFKYLGGESDNCVKVDPSVLRHLWPNAVKIGANLPSSF